MHERRGNIHSSEPFKQAMPTQQIIPSASSSLSVPGLSFVYSLAPPENRSLLLQEVIAYHTWLPGAEGNLPWCQVRPAWWGGDSTLEQPGKKWIFTLQISLSRDLFHRERIKLRSWLNSRWHIVNPLTGEHMSAVKWQNYKRKILVLFTLNPLELFHANTKSQPLPLKKW